MKIIELNAVPYGATGRIAKQITDFANVHGHEAYFAYSWTKDKKSNAGEKEIIANTFISRASHMLLAKLIGGDGFYSYFATKRFIKKLEQIKPDIIHFHIMHAFYLNLPLLFDYINREKIKLVWTFQDCWALSGQCYHFVSENCYKWKTGCNHCPLQKQYSLLPVDSARSSWNKLSQYVSSVENVTVVACSDWVANFARESMFKDKKICVINNGIDLNIFKPTESDFRKKYNCEGKTIVLGVAFVWLYRKGLDVFKYLAEHLSDNFVIVMVGTDDVIDKELPERVISIHRTKDQKELAEIYTAADIFINPTREDTYPTVNMEALACGTPVITFRTGGSPESIDVNCGSVVECGDVEGMYKEILRVSKEKPFSENACLERAKSFDLNKKYNEYLQLFENL